MAQFENVLRLVLPSASVTELDFEVLVERMMDALEAMGLRDVHVSAFGGERMMELATEISAPSIEIARAGFMGIVDQAIVQVVHNELGPIELRHEEVTDGWFPYLLPSGFVQRDPVGLPSPFEELKQGQLEV
ncbi:hypothetical protein [Streptomyces sp. NPDC050287]|uniref:hypothetical protein n=1 Tax=Streptomyces sp. NPDC050287 TaxID=3365608 RepID=UPI0037BB95C2